MPAEVKAISDGMVNNAKKMESTINISFPLFKVLIKNKLVKNKITAMKKRNFEKSNSPSLSNAIYSQ
jgi:hypothetical protein